MASAAAGGAAAGGTSSGVSTTAASSEFKMAAGMVDVLGPRNPKGIPSMKFLKDIAAVLDEKSCTIEELLQALHTMHGKYKYMESLMIQDRQRLQAGVPELERSVEYIEMLQAKQEAGPDAEPLKTRFNLSDQVYAQAEVPASGTVGLWVGANVMVEYSYEEARKLLKEKLEIGAKKIEEIEESLAFLRENRTTTEVNITRSFNYDVKNRRPGAARSGGK